MLALSGPEEALRWLLSQFLRYSFCGICGNELKGLALIARGQKSLFPLWPALQKDLCHHVFQEGGPLPGPETGLLSNTQK